MGRYRNSSPLESLIIETTPTLGAEDFRIVAALLSAPGRANWRDRAAPPGLADPRRHRAARLPLAPRARETGLPRISVRMLVDGAGARHRLCRGRLLRSVSIPAMDSTRR